MRLLLATFAITSAFSFQAFAQPATLEDLMKDLEADAKVIQTQLENRDTNKDSASRSSKLRKLFVAMYAFVPEKIEKATEEEKPALMRAYDKFVAQEIVLTADLEDNFLADDNAAAKKTFTEVHNVRRKAHALFK